MDEIVVTIVASSPKQHLRTNMQHSVHNKNCDMRDILFRIDKCVQDGGCLGSQNWLNVHIGWPVTLFWPNTDQNSGKIWLGQFGQKGKKFKNTNCSDSSELFWSRGYPYNMLYSHATRS